MSTSGSRRSSDLALWPPKPERAQLAHRFKGTRVALSPLPPPRKDPESGKVEGVAENGKAIPTRNKSSDRKQPPSFFRRLFRSIHNVLFHEYVLLLLSIGSVLVTTGIFSVFIQYQFVISTVIQGWVSAAFFCVWLSKTYDFRMLLVVITVIICVITGLYYRLFCLGAGGILLTSLLYFRRKTKFKKYDDENKDEFDEEYLPLVLSNVKSGVKEEVI